MKRSNFQNILVYIFLIVGSSSLFVSNIMMRNHYKNAYIISIYLAPIILFGIFFISTNTNTLKFILNNKLLKFIGLSYLFFSSFILVISYLKITNNYFYFLTPPFLILIIILLTSLFISNYGLANIFNFCFFISVVGFILIIFTFFDLKYINLFNSNINYKIDTIQFIFNYLFIYFDVIFISQFNQSIKTTRKNYFIIILFSVIINTLLILENYILFDNKFFLSNKFPYISKYLTYSFENLFEHVDLIYLIFITLYIIIRFSINTEIFRLFCKIKRNKITISIFIIAILSLSLLSNFIDISLNTINFIMFLTTILISFFIIIIKLYSRRIKNGLS